MKYKETTKTIFLCVPNDPDKKCSVTDNQNAFYEAVKIQKLITLYPAENYIFTPQIKNEDFNTYKIFYFLSRAYLWGVCNLL